MVLKNTEITENTLRVLSETGEFLGVFSRSDALSLASDKETDLIQINPKENICKLIDYGRYMYEQKKHQKANKQKTSSMKEVQIGPNTSSHDLEVKAKNIQRFFSNGDKVKIVLTLRGRERNNKEGALASMNNFLTIIGEYAIEKEMQESQYGYTIQLKGV